MKKFVIYQHGGTYNHGCEALATTISSEIKRELEPSNVVLVSFSPEEDSNITSVDKVVGTKGMKKWNFLYFLYQFNKRILKSKTLEDLIAVDKNCLKEAENSECCIAIGGDNYCYGKGRFLWATDRVLKKRGNKMMLWGASLEAKDLPGSLAEHLKVFDVITARESISYEALKANGFGDRAYLVSDPAFLLETECLELPENWKEGQMVGINLSPLVLKFSQEKAEVVDSVYKLIDYILENTEMNVALIPHVRKPGNDDVTVLRPMYEKYKNTNRIVLFDDKNLNCKQLKGYISRCRFFIGARTHSTIAAYSTGVPTIALGYSVKAKGIARDLFGTEENFVVPVQTFDDPALTVNAVKYLFDNEDRIKEIYKEKLPEYIEKAKESTKYLLKLINED